VAGVAGGAETMTWLQIMVLALVQGLTEFLPVSSSAHLVLVSQLLGWPDQGLPLDVAVHLGTLLAVLGYFRRELWAMLAAWGQWAPAQQPQAAQQRQLGLLLLAASVPVLLAGWLAYELVAHWLRDVRIIAWATIIFGLLLWLADRYAPRRLTLQDMTLGSGLLIGLAQVLALVPGTSRSGITMTVGRLLGFDAVSAARFSFLLSIPVIGVAGAHGVWRLVGDGVASDAAWQAFALAVAFAALAGWLCIAVFLSLLQRLGLTPFIIYRLLLGVVLLLIFY
jgi:undecaprenyl-diphosphatase